MVYHYHEVVRRVLDRPGTEACRNLATSSLTIKYAVNNSASLLKFVLINMSFSEHNMIRQYYMTVAIIVKTFQSVITYRYMFRSFVCFQVLI